MPVKKKYTSSTKYDKQYMQIFAELSDKSKKIEKEGFVQEM